MKDPVLAKGVLFQPVVAEAQEPSSIVPFPEGGGRLLSEGQADRQADRQGGPSLQKLRPKKLSLCMIVKNEEKFLAQCLESVQGFVDEMVIVDTGSTDRTEEIARSFGARVFHFPWSGNFAEARNFSLGKATGDWILILDADEVLTDESKPVIRKLIQHDEVIGYLAKIINYVEDGEYASSMEHFFIRLFPRRDEVFYKGEIHEQVIQKIHTQGKNELYLPVDHFFSPITILHYGYKKETFDERNKSERNKTILQEILARDKDNAFHRFNLAISYMLDREYEKALEEFKIAEERCSKKASYYPIILVYSCLCYCACQKWEEGISQARKGVEMASYLPDSHYMLGEAYFGAGELEKAVEAYKAGIECGSKAVTATITDPGTGTWKGHNQLGVVLTRLERNEEARDCFEKACDYKPGVPMFLLNYAKATYKCGDHEKAEEIFREACHLNRKQCGWDLFHFYLLEKKFKEALAMLHEMKESGESCPDLLLKESSLYMELGEFEKAKELLEKAVSSEEGVNSCELPPLLNNLGAMYMREGNVEEAEKLVRRALKMRPEFGPSLLNLARIFVSQGRLEEAVSFCDEIGLEDENLKRGFLLKAHILGKTGKVEESTALLLEYLTSHPEDPEATLFLAQNFFATGKYQEALDLYSTLIPRQIQAPDSISPSLFFQIGTLLLRLGRYEEARDSFQVACQMAPEFKEARVGLEAAETFLQLGLTSLNASQVPQ